MILVTGASGHLGKKVVQTLLQRVGAANIVVLVRDAAKGAAYSDLGITVRIGDYHDLASLQEAFVGVEKLVFISSGDFNDRIGQHKKVVDAAVSAGVAHVLYTGVSLKDITNSPLQPFLADHYATEDYIKASGLSYTFLQHTLYADVIPMFLGEQVVNTGIYFPAGDGKVAFATREDLGEAIAILVTGDGPINSTYRMTNTKAYSFTEISAILSRLAGKEVGYVSPSAEDFVAALTNYGLPEAIIQMSAAFAAGMANHDFEEVFSDLESTLGRKPTSLESYLAAYYFGK